MEDIKLKVLEANWHQSNIREKYEGQYIEEKVNSFCEGREVISVNINFNPSINTRHLAYIVYK
jgi:hypothetical protein|tara:strand:+ start:392 stop:580 length:189 start_codon:yes stop_codon:yes gene_type:complete